MEVGTTTDQRLDAWRAVVTIHAAVTDRVQRAFAAADLPPLSWFELLWAIRRSPTERPSMGELAEALTLSRGGITKLVDRLEKGGYVERVACTDDRRRLQAELTPAGDQLLEEMRAVYREEVERHMASLTTSEAEVLGGMLTKVTDSTCDIGEGQPEPASVAA